MNKLLIIFIAFIFFFNSFILADNLQKNDTLHYNEKQEDGIPVFDLEEVVTTGTRIPRRVKDITSTVSVVNSHEIASSNANYVMDVIGSQPGIYIRKDAIFGRQSIEIRGLGSNCRRIQTLIDGRPEKMSLFGCTVTQTLPLSNIERIEVIRGPESVLYGTDALGGVVNIITKKLLSPGFETNGLFSYGSNNSQHGLIQHGGYHHGFDYFLTFDYKSSDGHRENSEYEGMDVSGRIAYSLPKTWKLELSGKYFKDEAEDPGTTAEPFILGDRREYERYSWDCDIIGMWARGDLSLNFYQNMGDHQFNMPSVNDFWHSNDNSYGLNLNTTWSVFETTRFRNNISAGYEYKHEWAETLEPYNSWAVENMPAQFMNLGEFSRDNNDVYIFNELTFNRLIATQGVRLHYNQKYGSKFLPQFGLLYHLTGQSSVRLKIGKGFRQAKFSELFLFPAHNTDLEPEENWSYELAVNMGIFDHLAFFANPFYMDIRNFIQTVPNPSPPPMKKNQNSGNFYIRGIEMGFDVYHLIPNLTFTNYFTYMDIEDPEGTGHVNRQGKPEFKFNSLIRYQYHKFNCSIDMQYISGLYDANLFANSAIEKIDDFFVMNFKSSYKFKNFFTAFLGCENLLDTDYEQFPGYPMPGFTFHSGVKFTIK